MESVNLTCHTDLTEIVFRGTLDVGAAPAARDTLAEALIRALPVELVAADLERVDTAGLQLLLMFVHAARDRGLTSRWRAVSPAVANGAALLGLSEALELPT